MYNMPYKDVPTHHALPAQGQTRSKSSKGQRTDAKPLKKAATTSNIEGPLLDGKHHLKRPWGSAETTTHHLGHSLGLLHVGIVEKLINRGCVSTKVQRIPRY